MIDIGRASPATFLHGNTSGAVTDSYLVGAGNRALILCIGGGGASSVGPNAVQFAVNGDSFFNASVGLGFTAPFAPGPLWIPADPGDVISFTWDDGGAGDPVQWFCAGVLYGAFAA